MIKRSLLEELQNACNKVTTQYKEQTKTKNVQFFVLQLLQEKYPQIQLKTDLVRQAAALYDEYEGTEEYIHIPDINQTLYNLQQYPVLGAINMENGELEGVTTIKYYENSTQKEVNPYYPKEGVKYFEITGVIVKQKEDMLHKGLGSNLYTASLLGIYNYANKHPEENIDLNVVIDCTNLPGLYALSKGNSNLSAHGYLGENQCLPAILDGIYTIRGEDGHLVEAPTYVIRVLLEKAETNREQEKCVFSYSTQKSAPRHKQYEELLDTILEKIKQDETCMVTQMEDEGTGIVSYIHTDNSGIYLEDMELERNGTQDIAKKRTPRKDVSGFIGPMPDFSRCIEEDRDDI